MKTKEKELHKLSALFRFHRPSVIVLLIRKLNSHRFGGVGVGTGDMGGIKGPESGF